MSFRLPSIWPEQRKNDGTLAAGGSLTFYENESTTPKSVYSDPGLSVDLGNVITLNSAARPSSEIWLDGVYSVTLKDSGGAEIETADNVRDADTSSTIAIPDPASGTDGEVLTTDGSVYYLAPVLQLPDPTGHANDILSTDGSLFIWQDPPAAGPTVPTGGVAIAAKELRVGTNLMKWGMGTAPSAASLSTSLAVSFTGTAFTAIESVTCTANVGVVTGQGGFVSSQAISPTTSGFTASFFAGAENTGSGSDKITSSIPFSWCAFGTCAAP